jgi:hypothetical protein
MGRRYKTIQACPLAFYHFTTVKRFPSLKPGAEEIEGGDTDARVE